MTALPIFGLCDDCGKAREPTRRVIYTALCDECFEATIATMVAEEKAGATHDEIFEKHPDVGRGERPTSATPKGEP